MLPLESVRVRLIKDKDTNQTLVQLLVIESADTDEHALSDSEQKPRRAQSILFQSSSKFISARVGELYDGPNPDDVVVDSDASPLSGDGMSGATVALEMELIENIDPKNVRDLRSLFASKPTFARRDIQWKCADEQSATPAAKRVTAGKWASATYELRHQAETSPLSIPSTALDAFTPFLGLCSLWMSHQGLALNILPREVSRLRALETHALQQEVTSVATSSVSRGIKSLLGRLRRSSDTSPEEAFYWVYVVFLADIIEIRTVEGKQEEVQDGETMGGEDGGLDVSTLPSVKLVLANGSSIRFFFPHSMVSKAFARNVQGLSRASLSVKKQHRKKRLSVAFGMEPDDSGINVDSLFAEDTADRQSGILTRTTTVLGTVALTPKDPFGTDPDRFKILPGGESQVWSESQVFSDIESPAVIQHGAAGDATKGQLEVGGFDDFFGRPVQAVGPESFFGPVRIASLRRAESASATDERSRLVSNLADLAFVTPLRRRKDASPSMRSDVSSVGAGAAGIEAPPADSIIATSYKTAQQAIQVAEHEALQHQSTLNGVAEEETQEKEAPVSIVCDDVFHEASVPAVVADRKAPAVQKKGAEKEREEAPPRECCRKLHDGLIWFENYQNQTIVYTWEATNLRALVSKQNKRTQNLVLAKRLQYHEWPSSRLIWTVAIREHPFPKIFPYNPLISRSQRYLIEFSSIVTELFFSALFFNAECVSQPSPEVCFPLINPFVPSWHVLFSSLWSIVLAVPIPLFLRFCFAKRIVEELSTPAEKTFILHYWRIKDLLGYTVVSLWDAFCIYFILLFILKYDDTLVLKWNQTAILGLTHRVLTAPAARTLWVSLVLLISKKTWICDFLLMAWPALIAFTHPDIKTIRRRTSDRKVDMAEGEAWPMEARKGEERVRVRLPAMPEIGDPTLSHIAGGDGQRKPKVPAAEGEDEMSDEESELSETSPMIIPRKEELKVAPKAPGAYRNQKRSSLHSYDEYYAGQRADMPYF